MIFFGDGLMEQPTYLRRLLQQKVLLIVGLAVAIVAGILAGFTIENGQVTPRAERTFTASTNVLLSAPVPTWFQVEIPAETRTVTAEEAQQQQELIVQQSAPVDLESSALILAYLATSDDVKDVVATSVGGFADDEGLTAVRRTTQPGGDETFPGRLVLPIVSIAGIAGSAERAEEIAQAATDAFGALVLQQQQEWGVPEDVRIVLDEINGPTTGDPEGSNPAIPVVIVALGVFLLFVAAALIVGAVRDRRRARSGQEPDEDAAEDDEPSEPSRDERDESASDRRAARVRRRRELATTSDSVPDEVPVTSRA